MPALPGIYIFKDKTGTPIYIGKAKSLKKRVVSYFTSKIGSWKSDLLLQEAESCSYIQTHNENEALILEAELVQKSQPKFNILLKDGQPFVYLVITRADPPQIKLVRNKKQPGKYFGPFIYKGQARSVYHLILEHFQLYLCNKKIEHGCLQYHLKKCAGSCKKDFDKQAYLFRLKMAQKILAGKSSTLERELIKKIKLYNKNLNFEQAKKLALIHENLQKIVNSIHQLTQSRLELLARLTPTSTPKIATQLELMLALEREPKIIDCFDVSHFQSNALVGSCVRFVDGVAAKEFVRRFALRSITKQNDYAALNEIIQRRYKTLENLPDLIVIDGGKGQLSAAQLIAPKKIPVISLAKKEERVFSKKHPHGISVDASTPEGKLLIAIRDYAHHIAISYNRKKRKLLNKK